MFQPRNRRIQVTPMETPFELRNEWFSDDGDPETGAIWSWGCEALRYTVATHYQGRYRRYVIVNECGMYLKRNGGFGRDGKVHTFSHQARAAEHAETLS